MKQGFFIVVLFSLCLGLKAQEMGVPARTAKGWGYYIVANYTWVIKPQFDYACPFAFDRGRVRMLEYFPNATPSHKKMWNYVKEDGKLLLEKCFINARDFTDSVAAVENVKGWGYIRRDGSWLIAAQYEAAGPFVNGLARVRFQEFIKNGNPTHRSRWKFINKQGRQIGPVLEEARDFVNGVAEVKFRGKWLKMNTDGTFQEEDSTQR